MRVRRRFLFVVAVTAAAFATAADTPPTPEVSARPVEVDPRPEEPTFYELELSRARVPQPAGVPAERRQRPRLVSPSR